MNRQLLIPLFLMTILQLVSNSVAENVSSLEIHGMVATDTATWTADNFAGFYYDLDDNIETEELIATVTEGNKLLEPDGVTYSTNAMADDFEFWDWGMYNVIGFMGEKCFAGYLDSPDTTDDILFTESDDENVLSDEQLLQILIDDDTEMTVTSGTPLKLEEGYELAIKSIDIDGNRVYLELSKDGAVVDSKAISPSVDYAGMKDKTYYYKKDIGDSKEVVIIAAHFKNAFRGADQNLATVDGLWQLSDESMDVSENTEYNKMTIQIVTSDTIMMDNEDNEIILNKNKAISLMPGISIKTANSDELRYYLNKEITEPGTYELRGSVVTDTYTWTADNFAGFYYDIDNNIKTEELTATVSEGKKLFEPDGITYTTRAIADDFKYSDWGMYNAVGFLGKKYFAGYIQNYSAGTNPDLLDGANAVNLLDSGILTEILIDEGQEIVQDMSRAVDLKEGYSLKLTIASDKKGVLVELLRDKEVVDKKAVILPGTYVYASNINNVAGVPLIAARLDEPVFLDSESYFKVNAIWQISEYPIRVSEDTQYGIMTCYHVDSAEGIISLNNEANDVTLSKNKYITFMPGFAMRTADSDDDALRYYLLKEVEITYLKDKTGSLGGMR